MKIPESISDEMMVGLSVALSTNIKTVLRAREFTPHAEMSIDWWAELFSDVIEAAMETWNDETKLFEVRNPELAEEDDEEELESGALDDVEYDELKTLELEERIAQLESDLKRVVEALVGEKKDVRDEDAR